MTDFTDRYRIADEAREQAAAKDAADRIIALLRERAALEAQVVRLEAEALRTEANRDEWMRRAQAETARAKALEVTVKAQEAAWIGRRDTWRIQCERDGCTHEIVVTHAVSQEEGAKLAEAIGWTTRVGVRGYHWCPGHGP